MAGVEIICWANSRKRSGRCVAGLRVDGGGWVRPIGRGSDGSLLPTNYKLSNGTDAAVLDRLRIDLTDPRPEPHQPENWLISRRRWDLLGRPAARDLIVRLVRPHLVRGPSLLGSTSDRVPLSSFQEQPAPASLALVVPSTFEWLIREPSPGKRLTRAIFRLGDAEYNLSVTDPEWEYRVIRLLPGRHPAQEGGLNPDDRLLLTISLGEPYPADGCCYKLIASVVALSPSFAHDLTT